MEYFKARSLDRLSGNIALRDAMIEFGHCTHIGLCREYNEDTYHADANLGLWLVADGMGGHAHGEVASALARDTLVREVGKGAELTQAIRLASAEISRRSMPRSETLPMGTTIAALRLSGNAFQVAWVGDSRVYQWSADGLAQLSQDHSVVQELIEQGLLTDDEPVHEHPYHNIITQALGVTDPQALHVGSVRGEIEPGMQFLLCSDGLTEDVPDAAIAAIISRMDLAPQECVEHLILAALSGGGSDNITAILVRVR